MTLQINSFAVQQKNISQDKNYEEQLSADPSRRWKVLSSPYAFPSRIQKPYYVDRSEPSNIVVKIKICLSGDPDLVKKVIAMEDAIEKHLAIPGFCADVEFVKQRAWDIHEIFVDNSVFGSAQTWNPGWFTAEICAHEIMHHFGLPDEYDYGNDYSGHSTNMKLSWWLRRLSAVASFLQKQPILDVSRIGLGKIPQTPELGGIMHEPSLKPLRRHINFIAKIKTIPPEPSQNVGVQLRSGLGSL